MKWAGVSREQVARVLGRETVADIVLAARLGCAPAFVAKVRAELRMPAFPMPPLPEPCLGPARQVRPTYESEWERFEASSIVLANGHRHWTGRRSSEGTPMFRTGLTAYQFAFRAQHGQVPEGYVCVECPYPQCVEGAHLSDRLMRERSRAVTG